MIEYQKAYWYALRKARDCRIEARDLNPDWWAMPKPLQNLHRRAMITRSKYWVAQAKTLRLMLKLQEIIKCEL